MNRSAKSLMIIGVVLTIIGGILIILLGNSDDINQDPPEYNYLVLEQTSGEFTTDYNSSWNIEVWIYFEEDCKDLVLMIRDSNNTNVYDDDDFCAQYDYGEISSFTHVMNETYTFDSNYPIDIVIHNEELFIVEEIIVVLGALSCCFGIFLTIVSGVMAASMKNNQQNDVGLMPIQMGASIPIQTNAKSQENIQITQTYLTQPTIVEESIPPIVIVENNVRQEEIKELEGSNEKKGNFWEKY